MTPETDDNKFIAGRLRSGDESALELLFKRHFRPFFYYTLKFNIEEQDAKDIVHTTFIRLWEVRATLPPDINVKAWLYKVLTNKCLDYIKHNKVREEYYLNSDLAAARQFLDDEDSGHPLQKISFSELSEAVNAAIGRLPPQMREIFELSRFGELKYAEIAAHLGISVKTVETQISRALAKLRVELKDYMFDLALAVIVLNLLSGDGNNRQVPGSGFMQAGQCEKIK